MMKNSDKAESFDFYWRILAPVDMPNPKREYVFAPGRKYRFDFAWPKFKVAVEIDGGAMMIRTSPRTGRPVVVGRHNLDADRIKCNLAAQLGWRVFHYSPDMMNKTPNTVIEQVCKTLTNGQKHD